MKGELFRELFPTGLKKALGAWALIVRESQREESQLISFDAALSILDTGAAVFGFENWRVFAGAILGSGARPRLYPLPKPPKAEHTAHAAKWFDSLGDSERKGLLKFAELFIYGGLDTERMAGTAAAILAGVVDHLSGGKVTGATAGAAAGLLLIRTELDSQRK